MAVKAQPKFLVFAPSDVGGLAEHINYQVRELVRRNLDVVVLAKKDFLSHKRTDYRVKRSLLRNITSGNRCIKGILNIIIEITNFYLLAIFVLFQRPSVVFLDSYTEYFSPFWIWPHWVFARIFGITYITNLHDPVRDFQVGPVWFHNFSNWLAFSIYSVLLIHEKLPEECKISPRTTVVEVPVGVYEKIPFVNESECFSPPILVPEGGKLFLSYGFIRDNKNLDLFLQAMVDHERAYLLVAGRNQSKKDKNIQYYENLARELKISDRVVFDEGFISEPKTDYYFSLCDYIVLTYDETFRSQSGVLNIAANYKKPVIASAGSSPLKKCVEDYSLGVFCEPDSLNGLSTGLSKMLTSNGLPPPDWDAYTHYASWHTNIEILLNALES